MRPTAPRHQWWRRPDNPGAGAVPLPGGVVAFAALLVFLLISLTAPQNFVPALASLRIALMASALAIAVLLVERFVRRRPLMTVSRETVLAACLAGWALATVPFSYWPGGSMTVMFGTYSKTLVAFWLLATIVDTPARLRTVAWTLSLAAVPLALTGIMNFRSGAFIREGVPRIMGYDSALTENPNDLALMLNLILPLTVALFLIHRRKRARLVLGGTMALNVVAVIVTFSRTGFLTLATTLAMYCWRLSTQPRRGWAMLLLVIAVAAMPLLPSGYVNRLGTITDFESEASAHERWRDMKAAASFVLTHPLVGAGIGMDALALNEERGPFWKVVHDVYLELAVDLGVVGLAIFLLLLVSTIKSAGLVRQQTASNAGPRDMFHLAEAVQISLVAFAVAAVFHPVAYYAYFYYVAGLAVALKSMNVTADAPGVEFDPKRRTWRRSTGLRVGRSATLRGARYGF
jgi:probable O-glycosylation ligase (exosortase A-associated)